MEELNITSILKANNNNPVKIGELTSGVIDALDLDYLPRNIMLTAERIYHCKKHKSQYENEESYNNSMKYIPEIIKNPDYIGFNKKNNSINYVKKINETTLVAIKIFDKGSLQLRTLFPLTEFDFNKQLQLKKLIPYK